ncbi:hypothetical protein GHN92_22645 [Pseudomonas sp. FSL R10-2964]|uniref:hypothetical protein n=1 Tax=Pseudomonas sp. FSL R10-2964 TaxID=2662202 RepID=UPI0012952689|nr:hypothetical protein [Pseudomonas sp. FSL R10-2964]MQT87351.1 hypothetical protein [Pseudomonas sp. FSL R10-2964]
MNWVPITLRWPEQSTQWLSNLDVAKGLASSELASTGQRLEGLADLATTSPGPVGAAAEAAVAAGRAGLADAMGEVPACLVVTPFQSGVGQGRGYQRYLSAPNLLQQLGEKLEDSGDDSRPAGSQYALVVMFLGTRYDKFAATLARFNAVLPMPDLQRAERRAKNLFALDAEKWELPTAGTLPRWGALPLERCTMTKAATQALNSQLSALESYADSSPMADLAKMVTRKASQAQAQKLADLKSMFAGTAADDSMRARLIGPGNAAELRRQLLQGDAPGHEWGLSAGVLLVGSLKGLSFVRELVGL